MTSARQDIRDEVLGSIDTIARDIIATIRDQIPAYEALSQDQLAEVTAIARWGTTRILQEWADGGALSEADIQRFRGIGAARALDGRPLAGVLRAYRLAGSLITELVEKVGGPRLDVADAMDLSRLWMASIDTLSEALYAGHSAAADRVSNDRARTLGDLVDDLLVGRQVTRTGLADRSRELGITLDSRVDLLVLSSHAGEELTAASVDALLSQWYDDHAARTMARIRAGVAVAVLPTGATSHREAVRQLQWHGCRVSEQKVVDLPRAFRLAEHALRHAPARAFVGRSVLDEADAQVVALLTGMDDADPDRLDTLVLAPLRTAGADHLWEGLQAYLDAGSSTEAADLLGVHAQTMRYRLRRIVEVTGRDPRRPWDRLVLEAATMQAPVSRTPAMRTE